MKCTIQFLQVHQGAGLGAAIHDVLILDAQQVTLGDHDINVPHQAGDTVQVQTVLQLHLCEGVAAGMRANGCSHLHHGLNLVCLALCFDLQDVNV